MDTNYQSLYKDEYVQILSQSDGVYIQTFRKGLSLDQLYKILNGLPQVHVENFNAVKTAVNHAPKPPEKFGSLKERIVIDLLDQGVKASITFNVSKEELDLKNRNKLVQEALEKLKEKNIIFGLNHDNDVFSGELHCGKAYIVAEGQHPVNGKDSVINMYSLHETKPDIHEDGKVNFYELKLINKVNAGDWLGERIDATMGVPGTSVKGEPIKAFDGKNNNLIYDKNTVTEVAEDGKTVLYSKVTGAVNYVDGKITVSNHLDIDGDVDFKTGNIKFDGHLTIKGTVADGFYVEATKDIEINSQLGLGHVKGIVSTGGSVFIKGGIAGNGKTEIRAAKDVFTKFVDNASIHCKGNAHIGFYCINSTVEAKEVVIDSVNGQIIGGSIKAEVKVLAPIIGSEYEKKTLIEVTGFNRAQYVQRLEEVGIKTKELRDEQQKLKQTLASPEYQGQLDPFKHREYMNHFERAVEIKEQIKTLEDEKKSVTAYLKARGDGEIAITKKVYPKCQLIIKRNPIEIHTLTSATSFYTQDGVLKQT